MTTIKDLKDLEIPVATQSAASGAQGQASQAQGGTQVAQQGPQAKPFVKLGEIASIKKIG